VSGSADARALTPLRYDAHPGHDEITRVLHDWAAAWPDLLDVTSMGRSRGGRDLWLATLTAGSTGAAADKPALLVVATIHGAELTATFAALHLVHHVLAGYGHDDRVTSLLDGRALYVVPRVDPDGAEAVIEEGRYVRSGAHHPSERSREPGLHPCDIDGDGRSLFMRHPDPDGPWKPSTADRRLLVRREPDDEVGEFYRLLLEGEIVGHNGHTVSPADPAETRDFATNFHSDWSDLPSRPPTAGGFAGSEPEIQALLRAVDARPNITGYVSCHTFGAVHLHPPLNDDDVVPADDLQMFDDLGAIAGRLTGYPVMSYDALKHTPYHVKGGELAWFYHERGVPSWITEFWNPVRAAGITAHPARWLVDHPEADDLALLAWSDTELAGDGFVDWYPFDHPQLGPVELGGWDLLRYWYNPPMHRIESEVAPHSEWVVRLAAASPRLQVRHLGAEPVGSDLHRVTAVVANTGWLPTHVTRKALDRAQTPETVVRLHLPEAAELVGGRVEVAVGHLEGRSRARTSTTWWGHEPGTPDRAEVSWVVRAPRGATVDVVASQPRAGTASATLVL
jgi:murein tripeptide amidase MpaA